MLANLGAPAECEVHKVDPVGVNDGEGFGTALGIRARI